MSSQLFYFKDVRCNFPSLATPTGTPEKPEDLRYRITVLPDKKKDADQVKAFRAWAHAEIEKNGGWTKEKKKQVEAELMTHVNGDMLNKFAKLKDGDAINASKLASDERTYPEQAGKWVISLNNRRAPDVRDAAAKPIPGAMIDSTIRSGYWVTVALSAYAGKTGMILQLQGVMLNRKDEEFGKMDCGFEAVEGVDADDTEGGSFDE